LSFAPKYIDKMVVWDKVLSMRIYPECIPCFFNQALTTLRMATSDEELHFKGLKEILKQMPELLKLPTPTHVGRVIHNLPKEIANNPDPYREAKIHNTEESLKLYPKLKELVKNSKDRLLTAIKVAVAGNIIDFARGGSFNLIEEVEYTLNLEFQVLDYEEFRGELDKTDEILYLADNSGETVFDKVFIEELVGARGSVLPLHKIKYAVRGVPVLNDATEEDARKVGIHEVAEIVNSGTDAPGIVLDYCTPEFRELFYNSNLIISKGQGNLEALSEVKAPIYFLFKVKCPGVAREIGMKMGDIVFKRNAKIIS